MISATKTQKKSGFLLKNSSVLKDLAKKLI